jgi:hypothetical protein
MFNLFKGRYKQQVELCQLIGERAALVCDLDPWWTMNEVIKTASEDSESHTYDTATAIGRLQVKVHNGLMLDMHNNKAIKELELIARGFKLGARICDGCTYQCDEMGCFSHEGCIRADDRDINSL